MIKDNEIISIKFKWKFQKKFLNLFHFGIHKLG